MATTAAGEGKCTLLLPPLPPPPPPISVLTDRLTPPLLATLRPGLAEGGDPPETSLDPKKAGALSGEKSS